MRFLRASGTKRVSIAGGRMGGGAAAEVSVEADFLFDHREWPTTNQENRPKHPRVNLGATGKAPLRKP
ncbi:MAG: hypothetical protein EXQ52_17480 [Bryobacterales bacterium]|nr:hypothetical protein [Bryobacterales bacterium]